MHTKKSLGFIRFEFIILLIVIALGTLIVIPFYNSYLVWQNSSENNQTAPITHEAPGGKETNTSKFSD